MARSSRPCRARRCRGCCRRRRTSDRAGSPRCSRRWRCHSSPLLPQLATVVVSDANFGSSLIASSCRRWRCLALPCHAKHAAVVVSPGILRIEPDRLRVVGDGAVVARPCGTSDAAVVVGARVFRIEPDRLVVVGDSAVVLPLVAPGDAAVVVGAGVFGSSRIASLRSAMARSSRPCAPDVARGCCRHMTRCSAFPDRMA